jgi:hypothetical protein
LGIEATAAMSTANTMRMPLLADLLAFFLAMTSSTPKCAG